MIEIEFQYQHRECKRLNQLNQLNPFPDWFAPLAAVACLMPSTLVSFSMQWFAMATILATLCLVLSYYAIRGFFVPQIPRYQLEKRKRIYSPQSRFEQLSFSKFESRWTTFQSWQESTEAFELHRHSHVFLEPKRLFNDQQREILVGYLEQIGSEIQPPQVGQSQQAPLGLFQELIASVDPRYSASLSYTLEDFRSAIDSAQVPIDPQQILQPSSKTSAANPGKQVSTGMAFLILSPIILLPALLDLTLANRLNPISIVSVVATAIFPFFLIWLIFRFIKRKTASIEPELPDEVYQFALLEDGWMVGNGDSVTLYDWRDVDSFFQNDAAWIIGCLDQRILIPKRIFGQGGTVDFPSMLEHAVRLRDSAQRRHAGGGHFESPVSARETGNPFQPPGA